MSRSMLASTCLSTPEWWAIISTPLLESSLGSLIWLSTNWLLAHRIRQVILIHGFRQALQGHGTCKYLRGICERWRHYASSDHRQVLLLSDQNDGKSGRWGGARSKSELRECNLDRKMFLHSDMLKLYLKQKFNITEFFLDMILFFDENNLHYEVMWGLLTNQILINWGSA